MRKINLFQSILYCYCLTVISVACSDARPELAVVTPKPPSIKKPKFTPLGAPRIVKIDTCVPPLLVPIINKDSARVDVYWGNTKRLITVMRPTVTTASFFIPMRNYNMDKGLSINAVSGSFEDKEGNLWFATTGGGLTKYNGKTSITFTGAEGLGNNAGENIFEDKDGNIWYFGGGMAKYDGRSIINFTKENGLLSNEPRTMLPFKNGEYIIATRDGLSKFDGKYFTNFTTPESFYKHDFFNGTKDNNGYLWFGTKDSGIVFYDGNSFTNYSTKQGIPLDVSSSFSDHDGNLWFGMRNGDLVKFDGKSFQNIFGNTGIRRGPIHAIKEDNNGNIWAGSYKNGVYCYKGDSVLNITSKQGLADDIITSIIKDKKGNLWFGTFGGGVDCFNGNAFTTFTTKEGLPDNTIRSIIEDRNGNYWFGTNSGGVCKYDGTSFITYSTKQGLLNTRVHRIFQDRSGTLWFCTQSGMSRFDGKSLLNYTQMQGLAYDVIRSICPDKQGNLWLGTERGLSMFDGNFFYDYTTAQGLPSHNVRDITMDDKGRMWLGTHEGGIALVDQGKLLILDKTNGLTDNFIHNMTTDSRGNIWVCTANNGLSIIRKSVIDKITDEASLSSITSFFENFTKGDGLSDNTAYDLVEDKKGNIIVGTNVGITIIKGGLDPSKPISRDQLEYYSWKNGYPIKDVNTQSMYVDSKGIIWIGTGDKLIRFDYDAIRKDTTAPLVKIQSIKINNENLGWYSLQSTFSKDPAVDSNTLESRMKVEEKITFNDHLTAHERDSLNKKFAGIRFDSIARFYPIPLRLRLPYRFNNITFEFGAIEPARPDQVRYQYKLDGYDKEWSPPNSNTSASFGNIYEGEYTFMVKAMSPDGVWSEPVTYTFKVLPPFYRTYWAYAAYILLLSSTLYFFYRARIRRLEKAQSMKMKTVIATQEEERKRISRDLHDDIGTKLSALKLFLSSLKNNSEKGQYGQVDILAVNSEQLIGETIKDVREMLLNLSPGILEEFGFIAAVESLINKINQAGAVHFDLTTFGFKGNLKKDYQLTLYRIVQELINNTLKHSEAKNVSLQIGYREGKIIVMIEDDGKGFDLGEQKNGYGLNNLEARTKLLNGTMKIDSRPGKGTSVSIEVPYKYL